MAPLTVAEQLMLVWILEAACHGHSTAIVYTTTALMVHNDITYEITMDTLQRHKKLFTQSNSESSVHKHIISKHFTGSTSEVPLTYGATSLVLLFDSATLASTTENTNEAVPSSNTFTESKAVTGSQGGVRGSNSDAGTSSKSHHLGEMTTGKDLGTTSPVSPGDNFISSDDVAVNESANLGMLNETGGAQIEVAAVNLESHSQMCNHTADTNTEGCPCNNDVSRQDLGHSTVAVQHETLTDISEEEHVTVIIPQLVTSHDFINDISALTHGSTRAPTLPTFDNSWSGKDMVVGVMIGTLSIVTILSLLVFVLWRRRSYRQPPRNLFNLHDLKKFHQPLDERSPV